MYSPAHFQERDPDALHSLIRAHPLGTWAVLCDGELTVNHVPFLLDANRGEHGTLLGHVARANAVWRTCSTTAPSIVVFHGPEAYVSPSWYAAKQAHGKVVPTWNYVVVHAQGVPRVVEDREWLSSQVAALTAAHEATQPAPWAVFDAPADYIDKMMQQIVGIEIPIAQLTGKWKLSQNRPREDREGVVRGLRAGDPQSPLAALIERRSLRVE